MIETVSIRTDPYCVKHADVQCVKRMQHCCKKMHSLNVKKFVKITDFVIFSL